MRRVLFAVLLSLVASVVSAQSRPSGVTYSAPWLSAPAIDVPPVRPVYVPPVVVAVPVAVPVYVRPVVAAPPVIIAADGQFLGVLSANRYDPLSIANPLGVYGSRLSPTSIMNPLSIYGSRYSPLSPTNPYATTPPVIVR